jgi:hypothetical protein
MTNDCDTYSDQFRPDDRALIEARMDGLDDGTQFTLDAVADHLSSDV